MGIGIPLGFKNQGLPARIRGWLPILVLSMTVSWGQTIPLPPILGLSNLLFFDDFEYVADRDDINKRSIFLTEANWTHLKDQASEPDRHAHGYIYTSDTVLNYSGEMPGNNSNRVLVLESLPTTLGHYTTEFTPGAMQTDFYLQIGDPFGPTDTIPADVWFQFWVYHTAGLTGSMERSNKWLYVCRSSYPCTYGEDGHPQYSWMMLDGTTSQNPLWDELGVDGTMISSSHFSARAPGASWAVNEYSRESMGATEDLMSILILITHMGDLKCGILL